MLRLDLSHGHAKVILSCRPQSLSLPSTQCQLLAHAMAGWSRVPGPGGRHLRLTATFPGHYNSLSQRLQPRTRRYKSRRLGACISTGLGIHLHTLPAHVTRASAGCCAQGAYLDAVGATLSNDWASLVRPNLAIGNGLRLKTSTVLGWQLPATSPNRSPPPFFAADDAGARRLPPTLSGGHFLPESYSPSLRRNQQQETVPGHRELVVRGDRPAEERLITLGGSPPTIETTKAAGSPL
jgi:hypothetical protein